MDNLVLTSVSAGLGADLRGAFLAAIGQETPHRFRLRFDQSSRAVSLVVSLRPELPWIGRPIPRRPAIQSAAAPFCQAATRSLGGRPVVSIEKPPAERMVVLGFTEGWRLVAELATHGANLFVLDPEGTVVAAARRPRGAGRQLEPGNPYAPPRPPGRGISPFGVGSGDLDRFILEAHRGGDEPESVVGRLLWGVGRAGAALVMKEAVAARKAIGEVLAQRLRTIVAGEARPVIEGPEDPRIALEAERFAPATFHLLPWALGEPIEGRARYEGQDAAATAGLYHAAAEEALWLANRAEALRGILRTEIRRVEDAAERVRGDLESFADPERHRVYGEALLAGIRVAERRGDHVLVPDPYAGDERAIAVPCPPGLPLAACAGEHFRRHGRARRGLERARERASSLEGRRRRLEALLERSRGARSSEETAVLEAGMRSEGIPVGLEPRRPKRASASPAPAPRIAGVRLLTSRDGLEILIGKSGPENDRLTFKLASPEDFWFHAKGQPGAHVVVRNPQRAAKPPEATLQEAARLAAWFSGARRETSAEVQWTRRKYVRRSRGAPRGTVLLKRFEMVRVRPAPPAGSDEREKG